MSSNYLKGSTFNLQGANILVLSPTPTYPVNYGNRKRIFSVCDKFKALGAKIHFLHYPGEWSTRIPSPDILAMTQQWDSFYQVPPTRALHQEAQGEDHEIDEWWDYSIGDYLKWLFKHNYFDAFIVNYTYLSKAFKFAPPHVYKILDTHDQFTGRRQLLESQGIGREFFHTTQEQEAIALNRADLVWAIKDQEAKFFRSISETPVITMLHAEPQKHIQRKQIDSDRDYLVLGIIGANNSVNLNNTRRFLSAVLPKFTRCLAPIKIKLAGSMCKGLEDYRQTAGVELLGRVESVDDFYAAIDVALVPMSFSTGLKIKAAEALATGRPIVAHTHAMEGLPVSHAAHLFESFDEIGNLCLDIAFDRSKLFELEDATRIAYQKLREHVDNAFIETAQKIYSDRAITVITLHDEFFEKDSLVQQQIVQTIYFLKHLTGLIYYVDTPLNAKKLEALEWHDTIGKVVLSPAAAKASGIASPEDVDSVFPGYTISVLSLQELCSSQKVVNIWMFNIPSDLTQIVEKSFSSLPIYVRVDIITAYYEGSNELFELLKPFEQLENFTYVTNTSSHYPIKSVKTDWQRMVVPCWRDQPNHVRHIWGNKNKDDLRLIILASSDAMQLAYGIWKAYLNLFPKTPSPLVVSADNENIVSSEFAPSGSWKEDSRFVSSVLPHHDLMRTYDQWDRCPKFVLDLSKDHFAFAMYRETLKRAGIMTITPLTGMHAVFQGNLRDNKDYYPSTVSEMLDLIIKLTLEDNTLGTFNREIYEQSLREYSNDCGWSGVWQLTEKNKKKEDLASQLNWIA